NIIVLSDEAHRNDEGKSGINLRASMGKAFFFGFTGTPIDRKTVNTHRNYGIEGERYLDYYSIKQAIEDGATLPVTYEARTSKFFIDEGNIDEQFKEMTQELTEEQRNELLRRYSKKSALVKLPKRMQMIARDIVDHFRLYIEPAGFKAQVVCYDREATAGYKMLFDKLLPAEASAVIYSSGKVNEEDEAELSKYNTNKKERDEIIRNFKNKEHPLKFIIVCDMLLTGFDAPIEQVMYLDRPLRDHTLLQAIARTNRVYLNKEAGKIIDYYGITRNIYDALDFDEEIVDSALIDIQIMKERFEKNIKEILKLFGDVNIEDPSNENLNKNLAIFIDNEDKQKFFISKYNKLKSLFEFLSPDPYLKSYLRTFEWLTAFYIAFIKKFKNKEDAHIFGEYGKKIQAMIREVVDYEGITKNFQELGIKEIYEMNKRKGLSDEEKAMNLEKALKQEISEHADTNPIFQTFSQRLFKIRDEFENHQMDLKERIKEYEKLLHKIKNASQHAEELGFDMREYGMYFTIKDIISELQEEGAQDFVRELSQKMIDLLDIEWKNSSKREFFTKEIKKVLQELIWKEYAEVLGGDRDFFAPLMNRLFDIIIKKY
ncbi:MAG: type I restriction endonuclease subunit R, partial [Candidatus Magasanikbacteria bacterium]|nr:type I restriction endonuclease subunit R [Candidatus Magasanikbacteria bacterium]